MALPVPTGPISGLINTAGGACSGTPDPGNTLASPNPVCPSVNFTLSLQNNTPGTGVTYSMGIFINRRGSMDTHWNYRLNQHLTG
ncbi:MAG: hypothetical protein IPH45_20965 [Bacteroidales bacterium]|nr:hypothetical protein [Bacteroidales bacterium]